MVEINGKKYVSPLDDSGRIGKDIEGLEEFEFVEKSKKLEGRLQKRFVKLSSNYFSKFISEIQNNPNSSYETYLDNDEIRRGIYPNNFSVLLKYNTNDMAELSGGANEMLSYIKAELCAPAIMNALGVKTVYNSILVESSGYAQYVMSIDAVRPDEEIFVLNDFISCNFADWVGTGIDIVKQYSTFLLERECGVKKEELSSEKYKRMFDELRDEVMVRYLANVVVLGNNDYNARNYAILLNRKTKQVRTFPCFDYEFCFNGCYLKPLIEENIAEMVKINPKLVDDFAKKLEELVSFESNGKTRLRNILNKTLQTPDENEFYEYIVSRNIETFFETYDKVLGKGKNNPDQLSIL